MKVCRRIYHCKIQVKFNIGDHPQILAKLLPFLDLVFDVVLTLVCTL